MANQGTHRSGAIPRVVLLALLLSLMFVLLGGQRLLSHQTAGAQEPTIQAPQPQGTISMSRIGHVSVLGPEMAAYHPGSKRLFVVSGGSKVEVINLSDPTNPILLPQLDVSTLGVGANGVAIAKEVVAFAVEQENRQAVGKVGLYDPAGTLLSAVTVGATPDNLAFTPDGNKLVVANEGVPNDSYTVDPEGSISVIDLSAGALNVKQADVTTIDFKAFNAGGPRHDELDPEIRIFGNGGPTTVAKDLEPENVATSSDGKTAWVTLQENNALAIIDLTNNSVKSLVALGLKDHRIGRNALDPSNDDGALNGGINIRPWHVFGMYQPDFIGRFRAGGNEYVVTANEGEPRTVGAYTEIDRVVDMPLDPIQYPADEVKILKNQINAGRLEVSTATGDTDGDGDYDQLHAFGGRSFAVWNAQGNLVYDSGSDFEAITAAVTPALFNSLGTAATFDERSPIRGPEPEGLAVGDIGGRPYVFVGLEQIGGVIAYQLTNPAKAGYELYAPASGGEVGPEGLLLIPADQSPTGQPLLVVTYEASGDLTIFGINPPGLVYIPLASR